MKNMMHHPGQTTSSFCGCKTLSVNIMLNFAVAKREDNLNVAVMNECCY